MMNGAEHTHTEQEHDVMHRDDLVIREQRMAQGVVETLDARALWAFLGVKTDFNHWIKRRIEEYAQYRKNHPVPVACRADHL